MPLRLLSSDPLVSLDTALMERQVATFVKSQGITTQAGWDAFINGLTTASLAAMLATCQGVLRSFTITP